MVALLACNRQTTMLLHVCVLQAAVAIRVAPLAMAPGPAAAMVGAQHMTAPALPYVTWDILEASMLPAAWGYGVQHSLEHATPTVSDQGSM